MKAYNQLLVIFLQVKQNKRTENCGEEPADKKLRLDQKKVPDSRSLEKQHTDKAAIVNHSTIPTGDTTIQDVTNQASGVHVSKDTSVTLDTTQSTLNNEAVQDVQDPICGKDGGGEKGMRLRQRVNLTQLLEGMLMFF